MFDVLLVHEWSAEHGGLLCVQVFLPDETRLGGRGQTGTALGLKYIQPSLSAKTLDNE